MVGYLYCPRYGLSVVSKTRESSFLGVEWFPLPNYGYHSVPSTLSPSLVCHPTSCTLTCSALLLPRFWCNIFMGCIPIRMFHLSLLCYFSCLVSLFRILFFLFCGVIVSIFIPGWFWFIVFEGNILIPFATSPTFLSWVVVGFLKT